MKQTFLTDDHNGTFGALNAARQWVFDQGHSCGPMQRSAPIAIYPGDCRVSKWRNLRPKDKEKMIGRITAPTGRFRNGSAVVEIDDEFLEDGGTTDE